MMKKLRIFVLLFILAFSFSVKAQVILEIDCDKTSISEGEIVNCEGTLLYEKEGIDDIEFEYQTNLDINFSSVRGFMITNSGGKVTIHSDSTLYDKIMNSALIMKFTLSANENVTGKEKLVIDNIKINKANDINVLGYSQEFSIITNPVKLDNVCTLDSITIEKELLNGFNKDKLEYRDIYVNKEIVFIDAIRTSSKSSVTGLGSVKVPVGKTIERDLTVTAEDGTKKIYRLFLTNVMDDSDNTLSFERPDEEMKSIDNSLKSLEIYSGTKKINLDFSSEKEIYDITIDDENVDKLTIKATLNDSKASFKDKYGPRDITIKYGYNKEYLKVISESGLEKTITLNINYLDNRDQDNSLLSLTINKQIVDLTSDVLVVRVPFNTLKTEIEALASSDKAVVKYEDVELVLGDNVVKIEVTSEDGKTSEYDVNVIREEKEVFESFAITGYDLDFNKNKTTYDLKVKNETNFLKIVFNPKNTKYEILNNSNITDGTKIIIKITDDDGNHEYTINIIKESNIFINIICYLVFGIGLVSLVFSIYYVTKKKKHYLK